MIVIKKKSLNIIFIIIFFLYTSSYYVANSGYYEFHLQEKTYLTNEKIKEFENDIKNNQDIDVKDYLVDEEIDYRNKLTNLVYQLSYQGNKIARIVGIIQQCQRLDYVR